jgi:hypothetical protein
VSNPVAVANLATVMPAVPSALPIGKYEAPKAAKAVPSIFYEIPFTMDVAPSPFSEPAETILEGSFVVS